MKKLSNKLFSPLVRFGFVVRGTLYLLTGYYGLMAAIGLQRHAKDMGEIVKVLGSIPFGKIVLSAVFMGFLGYGLWGFVRATRAKNLVGRVSCFISGISYLAISFLPFNLLLNIAATNTPSSESSTHWLLNLPGGFWVIVIVGLVIMIGGMAQIIYGFEKSFEKTFKPTTSAKQKKILLVTGKYGYMARGLIFVLLGMTFILGRAPGGSLLLGVTSAGLMAFGAYSIVASRVVKLKADDN